jgi:hypothetical protein
MSKNNTSSIRKPLILGQKKMMDITYDICRQVEESASKSWIMSLAFSISILFLGFYTLYMTV